MCTGISTGSRGRRRRSGDRGGAIGGTGDGGGSDDSSCSDGTGSDGTGDGTSSDWAGDDYRAGYRTDDSSRSHDLLILVIAGNVMDWNWGWMMEFKPSWLVVYG